MRAIVFAASIFLFITAFLLGVLAHELQVSGDPFFTFLNKISGGNLFTPVAIGFSTSIAAITAYVTLNKHDNRESRKWTLDALNSPPFTWAGIRENANFLMRLGEMSKNLDDSAFNKEMNDRRNDGCEKLQNIVLFLDAYQQLAVGISSNLYNEDTAKAICKNQLGYIFKHSERYIHWRIINDERSGPADDHAYEELLDLANKWGIKFNYCAL